MNLRTVTNLTDVILSCMRAKSKLSETCVIGRASMRVAQYRIVGYDQEHGEPIYREVGHPEVVWNLITNAGRIFLHTQGYGTSGLGANGLNYIALSNDTVSETGASTTLSNEITTNGLGRAQGTVTLASGSGNTTTIDKTFTASGTQAAQKAALFTASSNGTMNHVLAFTQRTLVASDTLQITYTITLG